MIEVKITSTERSEGKTWTALLIRDFLRRLGFHVDYENYHDSVRRIETEKRLEEYHPNPSEVDPREVRIKDMTRTGERPPLEV